MLDFSHRQKLLDDVIALILFHFLLVFLMYPNLLYLLLMFLACCLQMQLPLETKVMIKVATHKLVVSHLQNFRSKHNDWQEKLPDLLKTLGTRAQFKKKVQKQQEKSKRKLARKQVCFNFHGCHFSMVCRC